MRKSHFVTLVGLNIYVGDTIHQSTPSLHSSENKTLVKVKKSTQEPIQKAEITMKINPGKQFYYDVRLK